MTLTLLLTSLVLGLTSTLHCAMMCGPLAVAACSTKSRGKFDTQNALLYFGGRFVGYAFMGSLAGLLGAHLAHILPVATVQTIAVSIVAAIALFKGVGLLAQRKKAETLVQIGGGASKISRFVAPMLPKRGLGMGLVTGFLPCGMLAVAWTTAAASGTPLGGAALMVVFAVGSFPGLAASIAVGLGAKRLGTQWSPRQVGLLWCAFAIFVGLRPLLAAVGHGAH